MPWPVMTAQSIPTASTISSPNAQRDQLRRYKPPMKNTAHDASGTGVKWVKTCVRVAAISSTSRDRTMTRCRLRSEEHTSDLQSLMRISYAVFCLNKKKTRSSSLYSASLHHHRLECHHYYFLLPIYIRL